MEILSVYHHTLVKGLRDVATSPLLRAFASFGRIMSNYLELWRLKWSLVGTRADHVFFGGEPWSLENWRGNLGAHSSPLYLLECMSPIGGDAYAYVVFM